MTELLPFLDLRSDACSLPTKEMRQAMMDAGCGNDDFSEDPTINELEQRAAALLGKEDAVFVQSGTMANLIAVMTRVQPKQSLLISRHFHIFDYEASAMRRIAQCEFQFVEDQTIGCQSELLLDSLANSDQFDIPLLCLENTINRLGGTLLNLNQLQRIGDWASLHRMQIHLDGARLLNAATALGVEPSRLAAYADTVMMVFTKALSAPAGAILAGTSELVVQARRIRWMLGGAWKQGGVVAAACLVGLQTQRDRVIDDHATAKQLAMGLNEIEGLSVDLSRVATNIVFLKVDNSEIDLTRFAAYLESKGARIGRFKEDRRSRLVTHRNVSLTDIAKFLVWVREAIPQSLGNKIHHNIPTTSQL